MATKTLTKEQWDKIEESLSHPWGSARLKIDGYDIKFEIRRVSATAMKYEIVVFVGGVFKGEWLMNDCEERRRFCRPQIRAIHTKKEKAAMLKVGKATLKRWAKDNELFNPDATWTTYTLCWPSFKPLKRHLEANNDSIEAA